MDTVSQFLTRIRNAASAKHDKVDIPSSNVRKGIAQILLDSGFIRSYKVVQDSKQGMMRIYLKYDGDGNPAIDVLSKVSKPGKRVYVGSKSIPLVRSGLGVAVISTSYGIMDGKQAKERNLGGEFLCKIW